MSLKVFQIAKELGVESKAIVDKCVAEGVPGIATHMSMVSAGLAETIREWFSEGSLQTAVEKTAAVNLEKVRRKRPSRSRSRKGESDAEHADSTTAVAEPPTEGESAESTEEAEAASGVDAAASAESAAEPAEAPAAEAAAPSVEAEPAAAAPEPEAAAPAAPGEAEPAVEAAAPAVEPAAPTEPVAHAAPAEPAVAVQAPAAEPAPETPIAPVAPQRPVPQMPVRPAAAHGSSAEAAPSKLIPQKPVKPVRPMGIPNVPTRPAVTGPAGPKVQPLPAQMRGPNVVRVEQPDNIPAPRPRSRPPAGGGGPRGPGGPSGSGGPGSSGLGMGPGFMGAGPGGTTRGTGSSRPRGGGGDRTPTGAEDEESARKKASRSTRRHGGRSANAGVDLTREWREADLAEREERMSSAGGLLRERRREMSKTQRRAQALRGPVEKPDHIELEPPITLRSLSEAMGIKSGELLKRLMNQGVMATVNQALDFETAQVLALEYGIEVQLKQKESPSARLEREFAERETGAERTPRPPVVTILGHVDHGKTSLLDKIRSGHVAEGEAGGITQHVGAYTVQITGGDGKPKRVTFLDTPGHQAFTAMRARGANMTDVVVLVVAADDGVMPQTIESINHAKAANVPIVVAMNKIDKPEANPNRVLGQLAEHGLNPTEWGGDTEVVKTSAVSGQGIKELIEYLDYVATLRELTASPALPARGAVIEALMDPNRGVIARVLVQNGTLRVGDQVVCGGAHGRVRTLVDDKGKQILEALPATPVEVIGLDHVPPAGEKFYVVDNPAEAASIAEERRQTDREGEIAQRNKVTLDNLFNEIQKGTIKDLRMILKADVQGSVDVLKTLMTEELHAEVRVKLLHAAVGGVSESDVLLAEASNAIIVGFNVVPDETARRMAEDRKVEIRTYRVIYEITDDIRKALTGMLSPEKQEQSLGHAEIRQVIKVSRVGNIAGCMVTDGVLQRNNKYRLIREGTVVADNLTLDSLKRFKEDVKEVRGGVECGLKIAGYDDIKIGDRVEAYKTVDVARSL